jgi:hypothetical protein
MRILTYIKEGKQIQRYLEATAELFGSEQPVFCHQLSQLIKQLQDPGRRPSVLVLFASHQAELEKMLSLSSWLEDLRIILVLPDSRTQTVTLGHRLRPRFVSFMDGDFSDVAAVLGKMIQNDSLLLQGTAHAGEAGTTRE